MPHQWVAHPSHLDLLVANYHAMVNNPYPRVTVQLTRSNAVNALLTAPAERYWVRLDVDAEHWPEGVAFNARCVVEDISIQWNEDGTKDAVLNLVPETNGNYAPGQAMPTTLDNATDPTTVQFPQVDDLTGEIQIPYDNLLGLPPVSTPLVTEEEQISGVLFAWSPHAVGVAYNPSTPSFLPFWYPPAGEAITSLVLDRRSPRFTTDRRRGALRMGILTDSAFYYCANALAGSPVVEQQQQLISTFLLLRANNGVPHAFGAYGVNVVADMGDVEITFDAGGYEDYTVTQGVGPTLGGHSGNGLLHAVDTGGNRVITLDIDLGSNLTLDSIAIWVYVDHTAVSYTAIGYSDGVGGTQTGNFGGDEAVTDSVWTPLTHSGLYWPNTRYLRLHLQHASFDANDLRLDDITLNGDFTAQGAAIAYLEDTGNTLTITAVGSGIPSTGGADLDDFDRGCWLASNGRHLYFTTSYTGAFTQLGTVDAGSATINLVRIPKRRLTSTTYNDDPSALHFIYGMNGTDGSARTLVRGVLNRGANSVTLINITPVVAGVTYRPVGPESLETYAGDSRVVLLMAVPIAGGSPVRLRSVDAGDTWALAGSAHDFSFVRWTGHTRAWLAGPDGIGFTPDRGVSLDDRDGDYELQLEPFPLIGAEAV